MWTLYLKLIAHIHRVPQKGDIILMVIYLPNLNQFSKLLHCLIL